MYVVGSIELVEASMLVSAVVKKLLETLSSLVLVILSLVAADVGFEVWIGDTAVDEIGRVDSMPDVAVAVAVLNVAKSVSVSVVLDDMDALAVEVTSDEMVST